MSPFSVIFDPFIKRQRSVIAEHAETVDHVARDMLFVFSAIGQDRFPGDIDEFVDELFVVGVMDMAVEHKPFWISFWILSVLSVVAHHRIMAENNDTLVVIQLSIVFDPAKQASIESFVVKKIMIMVSYDQELFPVQSFQKLVCSFPFHEPEIPQDHNLIVLTDLSVPLRDHIFVLQQFQRVACPFLISGFYARNEDLRYSISFSSSFMRSVRSVRTKGIYDDPESCCRDSGRKTSRDLCYDF